MAWLSKLARSFSGTQSVRCSPASVRQNIPNHNEYRMLSSFARTLPFKLHQLLVWIQKTLMTQFVQSIESFCKVFTTVDQTTRKYIFQAFTSVYLAHYKWPERHFHSKIVEIDISTPDHLVSAILILPVTLAPLTSFHASN